MWLVFFCVIAFCSTFLRLLFLLKNQPFFRHINVFTKTRYGYKRIDFTELFERDQGCKVSVARTFLNSAQGFQNKEYADYFSFHSSLSFTFCDLCFRQSLTTKSYKKFTSTASTDQNSFFSQNGAKIAKSNIFSNSDGGVQFFG